MYIGVPKEQRPFEFRVGLPPAGVEILKQSGHTIFVEHEAGVGAGFSDEAYQRAGARIVYSPEEVFGRADLLLKFARPLKQEIEWLRPGSMLAGLLHLASARQDKIDLMLKNNITSIAYEQIEEEDGTTPGKRSSMRSRAWTSMSNTVTCAPSPRKARAAAVPATPPPMITTSAGGTPGTPLSRIPLPPL